TNGRSVIGRVGWTFGPAERDVAEALSDSVKVVTGVEPKIVRYPSTIRVYLYSLQWARLLAQFGKRHEKHLPEQYLCGNPLYLNGLFHGLLASDGHVDHGRLGFSNTSRRLVELFGVLCFLLRGSFPNVSSAAGFAGGLLGTIDSR